MSRSNWLLIVALGGWLIAPLLVALLMWSADQGNPARNQASYYPCDTTPHQSVVSPINSPQANKQAAPAQKTEGTNDCYTREDLVAQIRAADAVESGNWVNFFTAIGTIAAAVAAVIAARAAQHSSEVAEKAIHLGHRAWLSVDEFKVDRFSIGTVPDIKVIVKNYGTVPALNVRTTITSTVKKEDVIPPLPELPKTPVTIFFPNQLRTIEPFAKSKEVIDYGTMQSIESGACRFWLVINIAYQSAGGPEGHTKIWVSYRPSRKGFVSSTERDHMD